jgi:hypothetical protein
MPAGMQSSPRTSEHTHGYRLNLVVTLSFTGDRRPLIIISRYRRRQDQGKLKIKSQVSGPGCSTIVGRKRETKLVLKSKLRNVSALNFYVQGIQ